MSERGGIRNLAVGREQMMRPYLDYYEEIIGELKDRLKTHLGVSWSETDIFMLERKGEENNRIISRIARDGYPYYVCTLGELLTISE